MYRYKYKLMRQIRMCKDLKHLIYYRFNTVSKCCIASSTCPCREIFCLVHRVTFFFFFFLHYDLVLDRVLWARVQVVVSGLLAGECGCSLWGGSLLCWRDGWETCWPGSLKVCVAFFVKGCISSKTLLLQLNFLQWKLKFMQHPSISIYSCRTSFQGCSQDGY